MTSVWVLPVKPSLDLRYLIKAAGDLPPGGHWVTINGGHVYIVHGKPWHSMKYSKVKSKHDIMTRQNAQRFGKKSRQLNPTNTEALTRYFERGQDLFIRSRKYYWFNQDRELETEKRFIKNSKGIQTQIKKVIQHWKYDDVINTLAKIAINCVVEERRFNKYTDHTLSPLEVILLGFRNGWADNSIKNPFSALMQYGAKYLFGTSSAGMDVTGDIVHYALSTYSIDDIQLEQMTRILAFGEICANAFYEDTQQWLKDRNISKLYLTRGMIFNNPPKNLQKYFDGTPTKVNITGWPLASCTVDPKESAGFATNPWEVDLRKIRDSYQSHMMIGTMVPREKIFSVAIRGLGSCREGEIITCGNNLNGTVFGWNSGQNTLMVGREDQFSEDWPNESDESYGELWAAINQTAEGKMDLSKFKYNFLYNSFASDDNKDDGDDEDDGYEDDEDDQSW